MARKRHFTKINGVSGWVYYRLKAWYNNYSKTTAGAIPVNTRKVIPPGGSDESAVAITTRYKHKIEWTLGQIRWLNQTLQEENPDTSVAKAMQKAYNIHVKYVEQNPEFTGAYTQEYDFSEKEVFYMMRVIEAVFYGRPTPGQIQEQSEDISQGEW